MLPNHNEVFLLKIQELQKNNNVPYFFAVTHILFFDEFDLVFFYKQEDANRLFDAFCCKDHLDLFYL